MSGFPWVWGTLGNSGFGTLELLLKLRIFEPFSWLEGVSWGLGLLMMCPSVHGCGTWTRGSVLALAVLWEQLGLMTLKGFSNLNNSVIFKPSGGSEILVRWRQEEKGGKAFSVLEGHVFALRINPGWGRAWDIPGLSGTEPCRAAQRAFSIQAVAVP